MEVRNQAVLTLWLAGSGTVALPATGLAWGLVLPGAELINLSIAGASTAARCHGSAGASGSSWSSRLPGARGPR
jgi:hypothetical protein